MNHRRPDPTPDRRHPRAPHAAWKFDPSDAQVETPRIDSGSAHSVDDYAPDRERRPVGFAPPSRLIVVRRFRP